MPGKQRSRGSLTGWPVGAQAAHPRNGGPLDLSGGGVKLPPPGDYDGVISDMRIIDKSDVLRTIISFRLEGVEATPAPVWAMLASRKGAVDEHDVAEGMRLLHRLAAATATPLEAIRDPYDLPGLFIGKRVKLTLAHKERDGVWELVVRTIRPR